MHWLRSIGLMAFVALCSPAGLLAATEPVPLNDFTRLGQRFTVQRPFTGFWVVVPSWSDNEGGLTLTLWDSPDRKKQLAQKVVADVADNAHVEILFRKPLRAGVYYWEIHERTGETRIGLYSDVLDVEIEDCAYLDGKPDRKRRFRSGMVGVPYLYRSVAELIAVVKSGAPAEEMLGACRELAVVGDRKAVTALAGLLADEKLSHLARYALERMPGAAVDSVFRDALGKLKGMPLVGVANSIAERGDTRAVEPLSRLLPDPDSGVAAAAAVALGRIGTPACASALEKALASVAPDRRPVLHEACLQCGYTLVGRGEGAKAAALFDRLRVPEMPAHIRRGATRGAIIARGSKDLSLLVELLRDADAEMAGVALWVAARDLPGAKVTEALAAALPRVPVERRAMLVEALGRRGDPAALPALQAEATAGEKPVRMAALRVLPALDAAAAVPTLVKSVADADAEVSQAAHQVLAALQGTEAAGAATSLLGSPETRSQLVGIDLAKRQGLRRSLPALLSASRGGEPEVRVAALKALRELAGEGEVPALLDVLAGTGADPEIEAAEQALVAACGKAGDAEACAGTLVARLGPAGPAQKGALLRVLGAVGGAKALQAVRGAMGDADAGVKAAALDVLHEWKTADATPDLLQLARSAATPADRVRALRGCLRIAGSQDVPAARRLALCEEAGALVQRDEERKLLLGALGGIPTPEALALVVPYLQNDATKAEAAAAVVAIAERLAKGPDAAKVVDPLEKVAQAAGNADLAKRAQALLKEIRGK